MALKDISVTAAVAGQLSAVIRSGKIVHAFLFAGGSPDERLALGYEFSKALLCENGASGDSCGFCSSCVKFADGNSEDFIRIALRDGRKSIVTEQIEELQGRLLYKPYGKKYVVLIEDAGLMNEASQNKLLKSLEEPAGETVMILLASGTDGLLPTVVSRCSTYYLQGGSETGQEAADAAGALLKEMLAGSPYYRKKQALEAITDKNRTDQRQACLDFTDAFEEALRDELVRAIGRGAAKEESDRLFDAAEACSQARKQIMQGQSAVYTLKQLCLRI